MQEIRNPEIRLKETINSQDAQEIIELQKACSDLDGTAFKLELEYKLSVANEETGDVRDINEYAYYDGDKLIGYIGICDFGGEAVEISGMTHPAYRRMGVFKRLFSLVRDELGRRGKQTVLLLCDRKSNAGLGFIRSVGAAFDHAEYEMLLGDGNRHRELDYTNEIALHETSRDSSSISYFAQVGGQTIGEVRLEITNGSGGIYGVLVYPEFRGKGYGKGILFESIVRLRESNVEKIRLQVDVTNGPALHIYESCGFQIAYTMDYYKLT